MSHGQSLQLTVLHDVILTVSSPPILSSNLLHSRPHLFKSRKIPPIIKNASLYVSPCPCPRYICRSCSRNQPTVTFILSAESNLPEFDSGRTFEAPPPSEITPPSKVGSTPVTDLNQKPRFKITKTKVVLGLETLSLATLIAMAADPHLFANNDDSTTRRSIPTNPSTTPPREFTGREVCIPDHRGLSVDTSSEPYPKSYLDGVADCVVITVGHSKARSVSDNNQKM